MSWMPVIARSASEAREGGLDLARHQLGGGVAHEVAHVGARPGGDVEELVVAHAGVGVAGHVAHGVAAALARGEAGVRDLADQRGGVTQRDVVELDVLARGDVRLVHRRVALGHVGEGLPLLGRDAAHGQLDPDHLHVGLALAVDPLAQPEGDVLVLGDLAAQELLGLVVEVRRTPPRGWGSRGRDVLDDLGVLIDPLRPLGARTARWSAPSRERSKSRKRRPAFVNSVRNGGESRSQSGFPLSGPRARRRPRARARRGPAPRPPTGPPAATG